MNIGLEGIMDRLESAMTAGGIAWWEIELPSGVVFFSENKAHMIGRDPGDFYHYSDFTTLLHPDDYEPTMQAMRDHMEDKVDLYKTIYRIQHKDGSYRMFFDRGKIVSRGKKGEIKAAGVVIDITDDLEVLQRVANQ